METIGGNSSDESLGRAFDEEGRLLSAVWEAIDANPGEQLVDFAEDASTAEEAKPKASNTERAVGEPSTQSVSQKIADGEKFWKELFRPPAGQEIDLSVRQKIFGSFFELPNAGDGYAQVPSGKIARPSGRVTIFGLEAPADIHDPSSDLIVYPFSDNARETAHKRAVAFVEDKVERRQPDDEHSWRQESVYWGAPFVQGIYEQNYGALSAQAHERIVNYRQEKTRPFGQHPVGQKATTAQMNRFRKHIIQEQILTEEEIDLVENFQEVQEDFARKVSGSLLAPVMDAYRDFSRKYNQVERAYAQAARYYNSLNPQKPVATQPRRSKTMPTSDYLTRLSERTEDLEQYQERLSEYLKSAKKVESSEHLTPPPLPPRKLVSPRYAIESRVRSGLNDIARGAKRDFAEEYAETSAFPYRDTVLSKIRQGGKKEPAPFDVFVDRQLRILGTSRENYAEMAEDQLTQFQTAVKNVCRLRAAYAEAETLWGPVPPEVNKDCKLYREQEERALQARQVPELERARQEYRQIQEDMATHFGLIAPDEERPEEILILPTGMLAIMPDGARRSVAFSPLGQETLSIVPDKCRDDWVQIWQGYARGTEKAPLERQIIRGVNHSVRNDFIVYSRDKDLPEKQLLDVEQKYAFVTDKMVDERSGVINPQLSVEEISAISEVAPYFGDFIYAIKKSKTKRRISLKDAQKEVSDYLAGARHQKPDLLFRGGVLDIDSLRQLVEQDKPGAILTINIMANCIGSFLYDTLKTDERKIFEDMVKDRVDVSRRSFYETFRNMVDDPATRRELMRRVMFVSYFGQYVVGEAPKEFAELMQKITEPMPA